MNLGVYWDEFLLSWRLGRGLVGKFRLFRDFIGYHVANRCGKALASDLASEKIYQVNLAGKSIEISLRPRGGDFYVLHEIFGRGIFAANKDLASIIDLNKVRSFIDLGSNVGLVSLYYAGLLPNAKFVCVEPDPKNFKLTVRNLSWLGNRGVFIQAAVASTSGDVSFDESGQSYRKRVSISGGITVKACTIEEVMAKAGLSEIDLIKIDIEGAEKDLLLGDLGWLSATRAILIEIHDDFREPDLRRVLEPLGFNVRRVYVGENFLAIRK